jgi:cysteine desulfurase/selenocysteine lyase
MARCKVSRPSPNLFLKPAPKSIRRATLTQSHIDADSLDFTGLFEYTHDDQRTPSIADGHVNTDRPMLIPYELHQEYRRLFPHTEQGVIYLNHAAVSPLSTRVVRAQVDHIQDRSSGRIETYHEDIKQLDKTRECIRQLINAESSERIAIAGNTSDALNIVASGLDWKPGDRILLNNLEFPANVYPYTHLKSHGVEIDIIDSSDGRLTPEMIYNAMRPRTRVLALSAVQYLSGYRSDLATLGELCR